MTNVPASRRQVVTSLAVLPLSTAAARASLSNGREVISAKDFGVVADGSADDTASLQAAIDGAADGGILYLPAGTLRISSALTFSKSLTLVGVPSRENMDNSWNNASGGTVIHQTSATANGLTIAAPDSVNSRINVILRDFTVRGSRVTHSGRTGHCISVDGQRQAGTFVRLAMDNVHVCEAPEHGLRLTGAIYGGTIDNLFSHRNGKNGIRAIASIDGIGEMQLGRIRCFSNGHMGADVYNRAGIVWPQGTLVATQISCSENRGPGLIISGGPFNIDQLQSESNGTADRSSDRAQVIIGSAASLGAEAPAVGVLYGRISAWLSDPGNSYEGCHVRLMQGVQNVTLEGYLSGSLSGVGCHVRRERGSEYIDVEKLAGCSVFIDNTADYRVALPIHVHAVHPGASRVTGAGEAVVFDPAERVDRLGNYNPATGAFTANVNCTIEVRGKLVFNGLDPANHDRASIAIEHDEKGSGAWSSTDGVGTEYPFNPGALAHSVALTAGYPFAHEMQVRKGGKIRIRYTVANAGSTVGLAANQSFLTIHAVATQ